MNDSSCLHVERLTNRILLDDFRRSLAAAGKSRATITHYLGAAQQFADHVDAPLVEAGRQDVEDWLVALRERYKPASVINRWKGLRAFYRWLEREEDVPSPMAGLSQPAAVETHKDVVPPERLQELFSHLSKGRRWRDAAAVAILYDTAMRAGELCSVRLDQLDRDTGIIVLDASLTKARRSRAVRLSPPTLVYVDRYLRRRKSRRGTAYLIEGKQGPMTPSGLLTMVKRLFREIGMDGISPHDLRHTAATHLVGEWSETDMLTYFGWESTDMLRHYSKGALQEAALAAHRRASPMERLGK